MRFKCERCGYVWDYGGKLVKATCPSCGYKVKGDRNGEDTQLKSVGIPPKIL